MIQPIDANTVHPAVWRGLSFLQRRQLPSGGFSTLTAQSVHGTNEEMETFEDGNRKGWVTEDPHSVFPAILIGLSLLHTAGVGCTDDILRRIADFLVDNRNPFGFWQHFTKEHILYSFHPCDVDDTALASDFLRRMGVPTPDNRQVLLRNKTRDGRIYTWFAFRKDLSDHPVYWYYSLREAKSPVKSYFFWKKLECKRDDIDAVVNANVLSYLGLRKETVPIIRWMDQVIAEGTEHRCDKWYLKKSAVHYFFSRTYHLDKAGMAALRNTIRERVLASFRDDGSVEHHPLDTALAVNTLFNLDCHGDVPPNAIGYLLEKQLASGSWAKRLLYHGGRKRIMGWGSEELTTGFCVEALFRWASRTDSEAG